MGLTSTSTRNWGAQVGSLAWKEMGLAPPESVLAATAEYLEGQDAVGAWIEECCERAVTGGNPGTIFSHHGMRGLKGTANSSCHDLGSSMLRRTEDLP